MNSAELGLNLFDDVVQDESEVSDNKPSEETSAQIRDFLNRTTKLEKENRSEDAKKEYVKLGKPDGGLIVHVLMELKGNALCDALHGITALGRMLEGCEGIPLFALSIVLAYLKLFLNPRVVRSVLILFRILYYKDGGSRKLGKFSKGMRCSKNTVRDAMKEVMANGLARPGEDGNAPGSGRPSIKKSFAGIITSILISVTGLDEEDLDKQCSYYYVESRMPVQKKDGEEIVNKIHTLESVTADFTSLRALYDEIDVRIEHAKQAVDGKEAIGLKKIKQDLQGAMAKLDIKMKEVTGWADTDDGETTIEGAVDTGNKDVTANTGTDDGEGDPSSELVRLENSLKVQILPQVLGGIIKLLSGRCEGILKAFTETEGKTSYYLEKAVRREAKLKSLENELGSFLEDYDQLIKHIKATVPRYLSNKAGNGPSEGDGQINRYDIRTADMLGLFEQVVKDLNNMTEQFATVKSDDAQIGKASDRLKKLSELLASESMQQLISAQEQGTRFILLPMLHYLESSCRHWGNCLSEGSYQAGAGRKVAKAILSEEFQKGLGYFLEQLNDYVQQQQEAAATTPQREEDAQEGTQEDTACFSEPDAVELQKRREEAMAAVLRTQEMIRLLVLDLEDSLSARKMRKNSKESNIPEARTFLESISRHLQEELENMGKKENIWHARALAETAGWISEYIEGRLVKWDKDEEEKRRAINYSTANQFAGSLHTKAAVAYLDAAWEQLDGIYQGTIQPDALGRYIGMEALGATAEWFAPDTVLTPEARCMLVLKLWNQHQDPRDIETWIEYVVNGEYDRNYGDPSDREKCCRITRKELLTAFHCLTGTACSEETLWNIFTNDMGYSGRQCAKLDQVGTPSKHRDEQFRHIQQKQAEADPEHTLVISVDTKAFLLLGRLKHDNGKIMCRKSGHVYRVLDHDFALLLGQIYPNGTVLVDKSRLNEKAVLRPVGAYCPQDGTGYVALVLGKDTAETVCNLIEKVIDIKREKMPQLDRVLILADGGGANMANGVTWQEELLKLADKKNVILDVSHFSHGTSKHNTVEHRLFSALSNNWKGKPFIDIEHVLSYVNSTRNRSLTVQGWFDTKRYLTNKEKKDAGLPVTTRAELEKKADGRIIHEYPKGEMYKLNYTVWPSSYTAQSTAA